MLRPRAAERAAVALLRLLLLLLPELRDPGLGVVGAAGAGLPESVIWAVNAGGEAHVDVHGIHFRKDPLEGRVGRGESPSAEPRDPRPVSRAQLRASSPFLSTVRPHPWSEVSLCSTPRDLAREPRGLAPARSDREPSRHRVGEKLYLDLSHLAFFFLSPSSHPSWACNDKGGLFAWRLEASQVVGHRLHCSAIATIPNRFLAHPQITRFPCPFSGSGA